MTTEPEPDLVPPTEDRRSCPKCGRMIATIPHPLDSTRRKKVLKTHGVYTVGAKTPFRECKGSGSSVLPEDPFEGFREQ